MNLPHEFRQRMMEILGGESPDFFASYEQEKVQGLRVNGLKISPEQFLQKVDWELEPVPWATGGFYYPGHMRPAKHPYYHAGLYYIQEPSAMSPAEVLNPQPGDKVLDLCAAPGGKTTQLAALMKGKGVLVANDNNPQRIKALVKNMERSGITNGVVTNEIPDRLANIFTGYFDKILVDAPCSGEGMFRKEPDMVKDWSVEYIQTCCVMQKEILAEAAKMLRPGGKLVYSTCTFAPEENEQQIENFLKENPEFELLPLPAFPGWVGGRLWPHRIKGEGHFVALLHKKDGLEPRELEKKAGMLKKEKVPEAFIQFMQELLPDWKEEFQKDHIFTFHEDRMYLTSVQLPSLKGLRIARQGWLLGTLKKNRFEPSQALAMGIEKELATRVVDFSVEEEEVIRYLRGETILRNSKKGWQLVCVDGFPLGWAKGAGTMMKNMYPQGWRWMDGQ